MTLPVESYREIPLTRGQVAQVSPHRFEELSKHKWCAFLNTSMNCFYAVRSVHRDGRWRLMYMHRHILGLDFGDKRSGDHKNHDTLDNRDDNIRIATPRQQQYNTRSNKNSSSPFKGVSWDKRRGKWKAYTSVDGRRLDIGRFDTPEEAARVYDAAARLHHGEFAVTNFPA